MCSCESVSNTIGNQHYFHEGARYCDTYGSLTAAAGRWWDPAALAGALCEFDK